MSLLQVPDVAYRLLRRYRLGQQPTVVLAPELIPVVIVDDVKDDGARGCIASGETVGGGGLFSAITLYPNPDIGAYLTIVRAVRAWSPQASCRVRMGNPTLQEDANILTEYNPDFGSHRDFRIAGFPSTVMSLYTHAAGQESGRTSMQVLADQTANGACQVMELLPVGSPPIILPNNNPGGNKLVVEAWTAAQTLYVQFIWDELYV